jgi:ABC-type transport system substrate-binding protein
VTAVPTTDWADYWDQLTKGKVDGLHFGHWGALVPTMADTLRNLFTKGGGCYPCTTYSDPEVDQLLAKAAAANTPAAANQGYVDVQHRVLQDFPIVPTFSDKYVYAVSTKVTSFPPNEAVVDLTKVTVQS